ncbi:MAG TPA: ribosome maturation factor RimM [Gaiellaceae bacterium]|nr:ribosome maturation factor RimM [Gaiellaceae bacterium]
MNSDLVPVGKVGRPHGIDGSFFVEEPSEVAGRFAPGAKLWVEDAEAEIVVSKRGSGRRPVLKLDRAVTRGSTLSIPRADLPAPEEDTYYVFQLVGLAVEEDGGRPLGRVKEVHNGPANDSVELESGLLLPLIATCVLDVDLEAGRVLVARGFADDE